MRANAIHICGTGSGVGKSFIVAGLGRLFCQDGHNVAPFKSQNMALNSYVTREGHEMGRAQVVQAQACRLEPHVDMNPILLKPSSDTGAQVVLNGKSIGNMNAVEYHEYKKQAKAAAFEAYDRLADNYDLVVMEGAGSPAEVNLKENDIVNLPMADYANASVILVGDIDKGGVFASLVGTLELCTAEEKKMIKGFIINKFRGDIELLKPGLDFLEERTGVKVLGVLPYDLDLYIPEEDSVFMESQKYKDQEREDIIKVQVVAFSHISNFTDFDALAREPDVELTYVRKAEDINSPDLLILPGSKNTLGDLHEIKDKKIADRILELYQSSPNSKILGVCGGYQMLGNSISDPLELESDRSIINGLGLLPVDTVMQKDKTLTRVEALDLESGMELDAYEIHQGKTSFSSELKSLFKIKSLNGSLVDRNEGCISADERVMGTYLHGLFDKEEFRRDFINRIRIDKGYKPLDIQETVNVDKEFDKLADMIRDNLDMDYIYTKILEI